MSRNFRQIFFVVFLPLLIAAGIFWMDQLRGYQATMTLLVLPKTELAERAAENLAAFSKESTFGLSVYRSNDALDDPFEGKLVNERKDIWQDTVTVTTVRNSDVLTLLARGTDKEEVMLLAKGTSDELVRWASRFYNLKTDLDIRVIEEPTVVTRMTNWSHFVFFVLGTALSFTILFFIVYWLIENVFPRQSRALHTENEYVISPDTFKPRVPTYWAREEKNLVSEEKERAVHEEILDEVEPEELSENIINISETQYEESYSPLSEVEMDEVVLPEPVEEEYLQPEEYHPHSSYAAAPDNLPIVDDTPITPLQGAQARLMKEDIDAYAEEIAAEPAVKEEESGPQTHEPTPEDYKRRLNELLSGKM